GEVDSLGLSATFFVGIDSEGECAESDESRSNEVVLPACGLGPIAVDDTARTRTNSSVLIAVLDNDGPGIAPIDTASVMIVQSPVNGNGSVNPDGTITYDPVVDFVGTDSLVYEICD